MPVARSSSGSSLPFLGSGMLVALTGWRGRGWCFEVVMDKEWKLESFEEGGAHIFLGEIR